MKWIHNISFIEKNKCADVFTADKLGIFILWPGGVGVLYDIFIGEFPNVVVVLQLICRRQGFSCNKYFLKGLCTVWISIIFSQEPVKVYMSIGAEQFRRTQVPETKYGCKINIYTFLQFSNVQVCNSQFFQCRCILNNGRECWNGL